MGWLTESEEQKRRRMKLIEQDRERDEWERRNTCKKCKKVIKGDLYPYKKGILGGVKNYICEDCMDEEERACDCDYCDETFELDDNELKLLDKKGEIKIKCPYCKKINIVED